jgi:hypothetical protein
VALALQREAGRFIVLDFTPPTNGIGVSEVEYDEPEEAECSARARRSGESGSHRGKKLGSVACGAVGQVVSSEGQR